MIDDALPRQDVRLLVLCVSAMVAVAMATAVLGVLQTWLSTAMGQQIMHRLRTDLFAHLQRQSVDFFTRTRAGEVQSRLINDVGGMQSVVDEELLLAGGTYADLVRGGLTEREPVAA